MSRISLFVSLWVLGFSATTTLTASKLPSPSGHDDSHLSAALDTFPVKKKYGDFITDSYNNPFDIQPDAIKESVEYDPESGQYILSRKIGDEYFGAPSYLTFQEYLDWQAKNQQQDYFSKISGIGSANRSASGKIDPMSKIDIKDNLINRLFGGTAVTIEPRGNIDLTFGVDYQKVENPFTPPRLQRQGGFDFDMDIQMNVDGKIGEKMDLNFNYNTQATFDFDNKIKIDYNTEQFSEDDIIKTIEAGDVSMPLRGQLIQGVQSLFGVKTELQFGRLRVTGLAAQQRSQQNSLQIENGKLVQEFEIKPDQYDENRHFFLSHYNRSQYEPALENMPQVQSLFRVTNIEVWVTNEQNSDLRNSTTIAAISDLGEGDLTKFGDTMSMFPPTFPTPANLRDNNGNFLPDNDASPLFQELVKDDLTRNIVNTATQLKAKYGMTQTRDFEVQSMRRLSQNEFTFHPELGFLSLNIRLRPNQVLGVAYEYTYALNGGEVYKVGEISNEVSVGGLNADGEPEPSDVIYVKMLKSSNQRVDLPSWDLMMKNVYAIGTGQLNSDDDFQLDIFYEDNVANNLKRFIPEEGFSEIPLLEVFQLDRLNRLNDPQQDGRFDFVPGLTVNTRTGSVFFPVLEPFGSSLLTLLDNNEELFEKYGYPTLYDNAVTLARENLDRNRFLIKGKYKSSTSSEYNLGAFNIPQGSVVVRAGSQILREGIDYDIDYGIGRLKIINDAYIQQGVPINISFEDQSLFSLQQKTMFGLRADFAVNDNFNIGGTYMRLFERPFTEKVNIGDDPINNRIFGLDINFSKEAPFITKLVDKLPIYSTKEKSSINFSAEVAALKPGHSGAINLNSEDDQGVVNIDDFEGAGSFISLGSQPNLWQLASTPVARFPEGEATNDLSNGYNRAKLNWYVIDDRRARSEADRDDPYTKIYDQSDLFNRDVPLSTIPDLLTFDMSYYPDERGPYNFDPPTGKLGISSGLEFDVEEQCVKLKDPETRWGGVMRYLQNNDFQASNFEYIEFWMLNPFMDRRDGTNHPADEEGSIYINLGNVSEDIMKDNLQFYENAIPTPEETIPLQRTVWGDVPLSIPQVDGFNRQNSEVQDLGFDGLGDPLENEVFVDYVNQIRTSFPGDTCVLNDPSNDNFVSYNDASLNNETNLLTRYKKNNNFQGNALTQSSNVEFGFGRGNPIPDKEDLNGNRSLEQNESYYEYRLRLKNANGEIDRTAANFITDEIVVNGNEKWYRFQIPIQSPSAYTKVGDIEGFRSIQFVRMYMTGFETQKTFRLAEFELARNQWRRLPVKCKAGEDFSDVPFIVDQVGIEENSNKLPFNYVSPRGIQQQRLFNTFSNVLQDERSMKINVCDMPDSCEARIYKLTELDLRLFKKLQMFVHASKLNEELVDGDMSVFVRLGKDFNNNYYEYEIPVTFSDAELAASIRNIPEEYSAEIWREENMIDFELQDFLDLKKERNSSGESIVEVYSKASLTNPNARLKIKGNPSLGFVKGLQIGVRHNSNETPGCAEFWFNELRMSGLEEDGGVAGLARLELQMADLGDLTMSGQYSSVGWGAIDQRLIERNQQRLLDYDIATNLNLGKFLPNKWNIQVPFYWQYAKSIVKHRWDQFELDLTTAEVLEGVTDQDEIEDIKDRSKEETTIRTVNFTNVRKERSQGATGSAKPWDIENVSVSYSHTKTNYKDVFVEDDQIDDYRGSLDYNYSRRTKYIEPFKKIKSPALRLIKEINFNPIPNSFSFSTQMNRFKSVKKFRLPEEPEYVFNDQRFDWTRSYNLQWDFTKSLRGSFSATNYAAVDELKQVGVRRQAVDREWKDVRGRTIDPLSGQSFTDLVSQNANYPGQYVRDNIRDWGRTKNYNHNVSLDYTLPIRYLPLMDWTSVRASYNADYSWNAGSFVAEQLGNVIQNNQSRSVNATFSFDKLYAKSKYLKSLDRKSSRRGRSSRPSTIKTGNEDDSKEEESTRKKQQRTGPSTFEKLLVRPLLALRNIKFSYNESLSTVLPGFTGFPKYVGLSDGFDAPGWSFVLGGQPNITKTPANNNWLYGLSNRGLISNDIFQNQQVLQNNSQSYELKIALEPWRDFKIDVNFDKTYQINHAENFINTSSTAVDSFQQLSLLDVGSFDISYSALGTLFNVDSETIFEQFEQNRSILSQRLASRAGNNSEHPQDGTAFDYGYGRLQNDVVTHAFLSAYTGAAAETYTLDFESDIRKRGYIPKPNWQLRYNGLAKIPALSNIFSSVSINHGYRSNLKVNQFQTDLEFDTQNPYFIDNNKSQLNYFSRLEIPTIVITEQFSPIIGVDVKTKNDLNMNFEYQKTRNLSLQTGGIAQLTEAKTSEFIFGLGWTIQNVNIKFLTGDRGQKRRGKSNDSNADSQTPTPARGRGVSNTRGRELTLNMDFSLRDDITLIHELDSGASAEPTRGMKSWSFNPSIDYNVNENFTLRMFVEFSKTRPYNSNSYPITTFNSGITARFNLN